MLTEEIIDLVENQSIGRDYPIFVKNLKAVGIKNYTVKVSGHDRFFTANNGEELKIKGHLPKHLCETDFNADWAKNAVRRAQQKLTDYPTFLHELAQAGIHSYLADLENMEVCYYGVDMKNKYVEKIPVV